MTNGGVCADFMYVNNVCVFSYLRIKLLKTGMRLRIKSESVLWVQIQLIILAILTSRFSSAIPLNITIAPSSNGTSPLATSEDNHTNETFNETHRNTLTHGAFNDGSLNNGTSTHAPEVNTSITEAVDLNRNIPVTDITTVTGNSTGSDNVDNHPSTNLAIIPALAILIILIVFCIQGCKRFRVYTRAGEKEEKNPYASILHLGDEEYGPIDIKSDTTSTACYDTVSSYCSFLKRNGNDNTITSVRSIKGDNLRQSVLKGDHFRRLLKETEATKQDEKMLCDASYKQVDSPGKGSVRSDSFLSGGVRTSSASSEEAEPLSISYPESSDFLQTRKMQRFKVSFVDSNGEKSEERTVRPTNHSINTSTSEFSPRLEDRPFPRSNLKRGRLLLGYPRFHSASFGTSYSDKSSPEEHEFVKHTGQSSRDCNPIPFLKMVSVGVQTDKSFRYNMWKMKRRHFSDPGHEDPTMYPITDDVAISCVCRIKRASGASGTDTTLENCHNNGINRFSDSNVSKNSINLKRVEVSAEINNRKSSISDSEFYDDVFESCDSTADKTCKCKTDFISNAENKTNEKYNSENIEKNNSDDCDNQQKIHFNPPWHARPLMLKQIITNSNDRIEDKTQGVPRCKMHDDVTEGNNMKSQILVRNCDKIYLCDSCSNKHSADTKNGKITLTDIEREDIIKNGLNTGVLSLTRNENELSFEKELKVACDDMTSSLTSLESSGYAENSSESSI